MPFGAFMCSKTISWKKILRCETPVASLWNALADGIAGDEQDQLDPLNIDEAEFPVAQSVSFFECRLFLRGTFEEPIDLLGRLDNLNSGPGGSAVKTWVVQGIGVLPPFAVVLL
jgi:hypothetical protein